jgi:hypothetical protein
VAKTRATVGVRRRTTGLIVRQIGAETLLFDTRTETAHNLPAEVTRVWDACAVDATLSELATAAGVDEAVAASSLAQLSDLDLLERPEGFNRRRFLARTAALGAGVAALPLVQSVVAPAVTAASTTPPPLCTVSIAQKVCSTGPGQKSDYTVTFTDLPPDSTLYAVVGYKNNNVVTDEFTFMTGAGGGSTPVLTTGASVPHDGTVEVTVYSDAAHTHIVCQSPVVAFPGC